MLLPSAGRSQSLGVSPETLALSTAFTYFNPGGYIPGTAAFSYAQLAGAYAVPGGLDAGPEDGIVSAAALAAMMTRYGAGLLNGIVPVAEARTAAAQCVDGLPDGEWYAYTPDWHFGEHSAEATPQRSRATTCPTGSLLKKCLDKVAGLPAEQYRCFPAGTLIELVAPPGMAKQSERIIQPVSLPPPSPGPGNGSATRGDLVNALNTIIHGSAAAAASCSAIQQAMSE